MAWIGVEEMYLSSERLSEENIWRLTSSVLLARLVFTRLVCPRPTVAGASGESLGSADINRFYREADPVNVGRDGVCSLRVRTSGLYMFVGRSTPNVIYVSARAVEVRVSASRVFGWVTTLNPSMGSSTMLRRRYFICLDDACSSR